MSFYKEMELLQFIYSDGVFGVKLLYSAQVVYLGYNSHSLYIIAELKAYLLSRIFQPTAC